MEICIGICTCICIPPAFAKLIFPLSGAVLLFGLCWFIGITSLQHTTMKQAQYLKIKTPTPPHTHTPIHLSKTNKMVYRHHQFIFSFEITNRTNLSFPFPPFLICFNSDLPSFPNTGNSRAAKSRDLKKSMQYIKIN